MRATRWLVLATVAVAAGCAADETAWPVRPPGGGGIGSGTGGTGVDAGSDASTGGTGRLCVVRDLRFPDECPTTAADDGVVVRVAGGPSTTTDASGRFSLAVADDQVLEIADGSTTLVPATARFEAGNALEVRAMLAAELAEVVAAVGATDIDGLGTLVVYVDDAAGAPVAGVVFDPVAGATFAPRYDDGGATSWRADRGTGVAGVALLLGVPPGVTVVSATAPGPVTFSFTDVPVRADAITFVRVALP